MKTLKDLYKSGNGPSSSHTMGPSTAARKFLETYPDAQSYKVILYDSLAKTGKGHRTDRALIKVFAPHTLDIVFDSDTTTHKAIGRNIEGAVTLYLLICYDAGDMLLGIGGIGGSICRRGGDKGGCINGDRNSWQIGLIVHVTHAAQLDDSASDKGLLIYVGCII